jgi:hypothetical protein
VGPKSRLWKTKTKPKRAGSIHSQQKHPPVPPSPQGKYGFPLRSLRAFARTPPLPPGAAASVQLPLGTLDFSVPDEAGANSVRLGIWNLEVGGLESEVRVARELLDLDAAPARWPARRPAVELLAPGRR